MTISEQLHFSILSAPIAGADRRALSQAWYSALYRANGKKPQLPARAVANPFRGAGTPVPGAKGSRAAAFAAISRPGRVQNYASPVAAGERRAPYMRLGRQIEQLVRRRDCRRVSATFILDGTRARVRVLVVATGASVRLIAVCSQRVRDSVARALEQARYASAAHGIVLNVSTREDVRC